jgi:hypothetical protein
MAINATSNSAPRELTEPGLHIARCYYMVQIGTVQENILGKTKTLQKVRIGWEMPLLTKVFDEAKGPQPLVIEKEYTLSMADKANLRAMLTSWRGKAFTEEEAKSFDITKLIGIPCMLNITHKASKADATKLYDEISGVVPVVKGMTCPPQVNPTFILSYDTWDQAKFEKLPTFITDKMKTSQEYQVMINKDNNNFVDENTGLPFDVVTDSDGEPLPF